MLNVSRHFALLTLLSLVLSGCTGRVSDTFRRYLSALSLMEESSLVVLSNSTTEGQNACSPGNQVTIQKNFPAGRTAYCRDRSVLSPDAKEGETCPGGVTISRFTVPGEVRNCNEFTVCGISLSGATASSKKSDGGTIDELLFSNLPWGCNASVEYSFDPGFPPEATSSLNFFVQPPECPFCARQNRTTCLPCTDLTNNEQVISGQVIVKSCSGSSCRVCHVLHDSAQTVPHGEGKIYYNGEVSTCGTRCGQMSLRRVCNDSFWEGDPSYQYPQCVDATCGCKLPGDTITYAHNASKTIYTSNSPACGIECNTQSMLVRCNDGKWETGSPARTVSDAELSGFPARSCAKRVCHCERSGREVVADGQTKSVFSKDVVTCSQSCTTFRGQVSCSSGNLTATDSSFLNFAYDSCRQDDCGCRVPLANNQAILVANGGSTTLYRYSQNTLDVLDACTNPAYRTSVTCTNKVLSAYDPNVFQYSSCTPRNFNCTFTDGNGAQVEVRHGNSLTVSKTSHPACGETCDNLNLYCNNAVFKVGSMSGATVTSAQLAGHTSADSCAPKDCNCRINGYSLAFGSTSDFYSRDKITDCNLNGCEESKASLTCTSSGVQKVGGGDPAPYIYRTCNVRRCGCSVPWGGTIEDGKTVRAYSLDRATCENPNACSDAANFRTVTCTNGQLSTYDQGQFRFPVCNPQLCECSWDTVRVPFGQTLRVYKNGVPPAGGTCSAISAVATCHEGGTWTGADPSEYPKSACLDEPDDGSGGGSGGGTGNDEGPGAGIKRRIGLGDGDGGGGPCLKFGCGTNVGQIHMPPFQRKACILPWAGGEIEFYGSVAAFNTTCVSGGDKCSRHRILRVCHFPKWTGSDDFHFPSCEEKDSCP